MTYKNLIKCPVCDSTGEHPKGHGCLHCKGEGMVKRKDYSKPEYDDMQDFEDRISPPIDDMGE